MERTKRYESAIFSAEVIKEAVKVFDSFDTEDTLQKILTIDTEKDTWRYDTENEFYAAYREGFNRASFSKNCMDYSFDITVYGVFSDYNKDTEVSIEAPDKLEILKVFEIFEANYADAKIPEETPVDAEPPSPTIFIGHGKNPAWRDLKDHLHEKHGYEVEA